MTTNRDVLSPEDQAELVASAIEAQMHGHWPAAAQLLHRAMPSSFHGYTACLGLVATIVAAVPGWTPDGGIEVQAVKFDPAADDDIGSAIGALLAAGGNDDQEGSELVWRQLTDDQQVKVACGLLQGAAFAERARRSRG